MQKELEIMARKQLKTNLYLQNPKLAYCSLNAMRTICDYYLTTPPSRKKLLHMLKTGAKSGTYFGNIVKTAQDIGLKYYQRKTITFKNITKTINSGNLILISYQSGLEESHSSVICGYAERRSVKYAVLCDSWLGYYEMPYSILRVLVKSDSGRILCFKGKNNGK